MMSNRVQGISLAACSVLVLSVPCGCNAPQSGRSWSFDREARQLAGVKVNMPVEQSGPRQFSVDDVHHQLVVRLSVHVTKEWQPVNFYAATDWQLNVLGQESKVRVGELSDPSGYSSPPDGMEDNSANIPVSVRRPIPTVVEDPQSLERYPVSLTWMIRTRELHQDGSRPSQLRDLHSMSDEGLPPIRITTSTKRDFRLPESAIAKLVDSGYERFQMDFILSPEDWTDGEALGVFRKAHPSGSVAYKVEFARVDLLEALESRQQ